MINYNYNNEWECWLMNALSSIPQNVPLNEAIKVEETLKELYTEITGKSI